MSECQICFTDMYTDGAVQAYDPNCKEDTDCGISVFRISCGHAFHSNCLMRSYRSNVKGCPTCRTTAPTEETSNRSRTLRTEIVRTDTRLDLNFSLTPNVVSVADMFMNALQDAILPEIQNAENLIVSSAEVSQAAEKLQNLRRKKPQVQSARHKLNVAKKKYLEHEHLLLEEKSLRVKDCLDEFRENHQAKQDSLRRELKRELKKCAHIEKIALEREYGTDEANQICNVLRFDETEYSFNNISHRRPSNRFGCNETHEVPEPSRQSFWFQ